MTTPSFVRVSALLLAASVTTARAQDAPPAAPTVKAPYALPWQLRSLAIADVVRLDTSVSSYRDKDNARGIGTTSVLLGAHPLSKELAAIVRLTMLRNQPPTPGLAATNLANPAFGLIRVSKLNAMWKLGLFVGVTLPVGSGGSSAPNKARQAANPVGALSRAAMDNSLFAVNYTALIPGIGVAYNHAGLTVQAEATLFAQARVRGSAVDKDAFRLNATTGLTIGYTFSPAIAAIAELHYQRWLSNDTVDAAANPARQNLSIALGPRFTIKTHNLTLRPGAALGFGLLGPIASADYTYPIHAVTTAFIDLPVIF